MSTSESGRGGVPLETLRAALKGQYHAALGMLRQAIERCPERLWSGGGYLNPTWRIAYHAIFYTHLYLQPDDASFRPWEHHQTGVHDLDDVPAPPEIQALTEHPHRPPQTGEPYSREQLLEYWAMCDRMVDGAIDAMDLLSPTCGFRWYDLPKLDHQLVTIRHIQHHAAQLGARLREATGGETAIDWIGSGATPRSFEDLLDEHGRFSG